MATSTESWSYVGIQEEEQCRPLPPYTRVTAVRDFNPEHPHDLPFVCGDQLTILEPCNVIFWYLAEDGQGKRGVIPINFVKVDEVTKPLRPKPAKPPKPPALLPPPPPPSSPLYISSSTFSGPHSTSSLSATSNPLIHRKHSPQTIPRSSVKPFHRTSSLEKLEAATFAPPPLPPPPATPPKPSRHAPFSASPTLPQKTSITQPSMSPPPTHPMTTTPTPRLLTTPTSAHTNGDHNKLNGNDSDGDFAGPPTLPPRLPPPIPTRDNPTRPSPTTSPSVIRRGNQFSHSMSPPPPPPPILPKSVKHQPPQKSRQHSQDFSLSSPPSPPPPLLPKSGKPWLPVPSSPPPNIIFSQPKMTTPTLATPPAATPRSGSSKRLDYENKEPLLPFSRAPAVVVAPRSHPTGGPSIDIDNRPPAPLPPEAFLADGNETTPGTPPSSHPVASRGKYQTNQDFISKSGWFQPTVEAVLCRKSNIQLPVFQNMTVGLYIFKHRYTDHKQYVGKSTNFYTGMIQMFHRLFQKPENKLNPLELEIKYNASDADGWYVRMIMVRNIEKLDLEQAKLIAQLHTVRPEGLNLSLEFSCREDWDEFATWFKEHRRREKMKKMMMMTPKERGLSLGESGGGAQLEKSMININSVTS